jgi:hypothetical protein
MAPAVPYVACIYSAAPIGPHPAGHACGGGWQVENRNALKTMECAKIGSRPLQYVSVPYDQTDRQTVLVIKSTSSVHRARASGRLN